MRRVQALTRRCAAAAGRAAVSHWQCVCTFSAGVSPPAIGFNRKEGWDGLFFFQESSWNLKSLYVISLLERDPRPKEKYNFCYSCFAYKKKTWCVRLHSSTDGLKEVAGLSSKTTACTVQVPLSNSGLQSRVPAQIHFLNSKLSPNHNFLVSFVYPKLCNPC